jgi:hypothetical protein
MPPLNIGLGNDARGIMSENLRNHFEKLNREFGIEIIAIAPDLSPKGLYCDWLLYKAHSGEITIGWLVEDVKLITEQDGPLSHSCPLAFLELSPPKPDTFSDGWRQQVKWYWFVKSHPEKQHNDIWTAHIAGHNARNTKLLKDNPYPSDSPLHLAWKSGFTGSP